MATKPEVREERTSDDAKLLDQLLAEEEMLAQLQLMDALNKEEMQLAEMLAQLQLQQTSASKLSSPYTAGACDSASYLGMFMAQVC